MPDKELDAVKNGDKKAFDGLLERFQPLIKKEVALAVTRSEELKSHYDEISQEALMALYDAALSYDGEKNVTFGLYAKICIHNRIISYVRKTKTQLRRLMKSQEAAKESIKKSASPDELLEASLKKAEFKVFLNESLSSLEKKVFSLYVQKKSYAEIAETLGKSEKSVDNAIFRIKSKIKKRF